MAEDIKREIICRIKDIVQSSGLEYREPIVGFASAEDSMYEDISTRLQSLHVKPKEMLPTAKTVIVYFLPVGERLITQVRSGGNRIVQDWSDYYDEGNRLLSVIGKDLLTMLHAKGINGVMDPPTGNYDEDSLTAHWGHKVSAVVAGIGTFGLNHLVITDSGTAGRMGSIVIDHALEPTSRKSAEQCLFYLNGSCKVCITQCPSGALTVDGLDKFRCDAYLDGKNLRDNQQGCSCCSSGPCAMRGFRKQEMVDGRK